MMSHGLSGSGPTGDYTLGQALRLMEGFVDALQLDDISLAGTSLGGTLAVHYAAKHPDRFQRLILLSPGSLWVKERWAQGGIPRVGYVPKYILPRALPEFMLSSGFGNPAALPHSLVDRWWGLWRCGASARRSATGGRSTRRAILTGGSARCACRCSCCRAN